MKSVIKTILTLTFAITLVCACCMAAADEVSTVIFSDNGLDTPIDGVAFEGNVLKISQPGAYVLMGELTDGQIAVDCAVDGKVMLVLSGVRVHNEHGPAILIGHCAPRAEISLAKQTENVLSDGKNLVYTDGDEPNGVIFSSSDLTISGSGSLSVTSGAMDGIVSKDDLKIEDGEITVTSARHGIRGKDFVMISGGTIRITAAGDGIKSTNKSDPDRGWVEISGGYISIQCGDEAIQTVTGCSIQEAVVEFLVKK